MDRNVPDNWMSEDAKATTSRKAGVARGLGWFSIALGITEVLAPRAVARVAGVADSPGLIRAYGLREIACGLGILTARRPGPFLWARVAGDALDISTVASAAATTSGASAARVASSLVALAGVTAFDVYAATSCEAMAQASASARLRDYRLRSGFPSTPAAMRGAAMTNFVIPKDMATPKALQSFTRKGQ
jgi:hypothetical protein